VRPRRTARRHLRLDPRRQRCGDTVERPDGPCRGPTLTSPPGDTSRGGADNIFSSDQVTADHVTFDNQFGRQLSANLFAPTKVNRSGNNSLWW
jgi:hypothetical protein